MQSTGHSLVTHSEVLILMNLNLVWIEMDLSLILAQEQNLKLEDQISVAYLVQLDSQLKQCLMAKLLAFHRNCLQD